MTLTAEMIAPIEIHQAEVLKKLNTVIEGYTESEDFGLIESFVNQIIDMLQEQNFSKESVQLAIDNVEQEVDIALSKQLTNDYLAAVSKITTALKIFKKHLV